MSLVVSADISDLFEDTLEKNSGVLNSVVSNQLAGSVVQALPASVPQQAQPVSNRLSDAQIAAINQQLAQAASANYPQAVPAGYPQALPASYPQALPANYPQAIPASYRPVTPQNVQYIPYPVATKHDDDEEEEDEEEEDEEEEDEEEFDADDLVTRRRRR
ncbi:hypothetical protein FB192DRAFT_1337973 [Mucor lusitanicus]|uniref:Uncharacterized protein n=2 Tax=Mucor circinelloides f. lusitanicus TaxID=29924 RepID=A0A162T661_MUCCL|nr:hypothetical protein FB192DRAFT_1337973 [Mucor lusitanicus]OAD02182.1 hypothetical protein MUCCIDRAFT_111545 [Mucor lusitanicus CBS 277.49]